MKKILGLLSIFILASSITLSCPDKNYHDTMVGIIKDLDSVLSIKVDTMYIDQNQLALLTMVSFPNDNDKQSAFVKELFTALVTYCQNHDLKLESLGK